MDRLIYGVYSPGMRRRWSRPRPEQVRTLSLSPQCSLTDEAPTEGQQVIIPEAEPGTCRPRVMVDPDIDEYLGDNTNTAVPLKRVDKGKGKAKAIDLNEESPPQGMLTPLLS